MGGGGEFFNRRYADLISVRGIAAKATHGIIYALYRAFDTQGVQ